MGTWGTSISANDTFAAVYDRFFDYYNNNWEIDLIIEQLIKENQETLEIEWDADNFWFALAQALWECKALDIDTYNKIKEIIDTGHDLKVWKELDASERDLVKRKKVLDKFLKQISAPKSKAKARKKIIIKIVEPIFEKGDCLIFKMENGNYGGAIVYEAEKEGEYGYNFIAVTGINRKGKPSLSDFETANILTIWDKENYGKIETKLDDEEPIAYWFKAEHYKAFADKFEKIAGLGVNKKFDHLFLGSFRVWIPWDVLIVFAQQTFERIRNGQTPKLKILASAWRV
jgi:hypothetical protein